jgi:RimJ/RimL family protein N-acetyltransferase
MAWTLTENLDEYLAGAGAFLRAQPVEHTIELAAAQTLRAAGLGAFGSQPPLFGWWRPAGAAITAAAFHTPPYPLLLSGSPAAAGSLARDLAARRRPLPGVNAEAELATSFAAAWQELTGATSTVQRRSRLFQLGELADPSPMPPGSARAATERDTGLLRGWSADFSAETGNTVDEDRMLADRLSYGGLMLWETTDGTPVAMAGNNRPGAGVVRIGPVFTPRDQRRRGYGGAVTVAVSRAALRAGAVAVVLFTDLANPSSNALYARLGFRPVADRLMLAFSPATCS